MEDHWSFQYRYSVDLDSYGATISERWGNLSADEGARKWFTVEDQGDVTSIRIMHEKGDGSIQSQGILLPTDLFRQAVRWGIRTVR